MPITNAVHAVWEEFCRGREIMRHARILLVAFTVLFALDLSAKDVYLAIGGSVNNFRTDARILNPSADKTIQVQAWLLAPGNVDNTAVQPRTITIGPREMAVYDDVVSSLFQASGVGAIRLSSPDDFIATQRIYAQTDTGTLGQFVPGIDAVGGLTQGALIQLKKNTAYRTNLGVVNPNSQSATVTWRLHDRNNDLVAVGSPMVLKPFGVVAPTPMDSSAFYTVGNADISDAWVSFTSDRPVIAYASVVDNATTDPTYITASEDTGEDPPLQQTKVFSVRARQFTFTISPAFNIRTGDQVELRLQTSDVTHGFSLVGPDGRILVDALTMNPGDAPDIRTFSAELAGTYTYFCTHALCGEGHSEMTGAFTVTNN